MCIRPYTNSDKIALLKLLRLNTPRYFDQAEEVDFIEYLDKYREEYYVVEEEGKIVGAGGINYLAEQDEARISWDIIHPDFQGKGIGRKLTLYRIDQIRKNGAVNSICVRTSQLVYPFYEKMGFALEKTEKDYWAKGLDLYQLRMPVTDDPIIHNQVKEEPT